MIRPLAFALLLLGGAAGPDTPVADAAREGDIEAVRELLRAGEDVNEAHGDGMTALHWAAQRGEVALAEVLIYAGAYLEAGTRIGGYTPLHVAARAGREEVAILLLEAGSDPNTSTTNSGAMPLHLAALTGSTALIAALIEAGAEVDAVEASWGQTPLAFAASRNRVEAARMLIAAGADPNRPSRWIDTAEWAEADEAAEQRLTGFLDDLREKEGGGAEWQPTPSQVQAAVEASREIQRKWPDVPKPEEDEGARGPANAEGAPVAGDSVSAWTAPDTTNATGAAAEEAEDADPEAQGSEAQGDDAQGSEAEEPRPLSYAEQVSGWGGLTPLLHAVRQGHEEAALALLEGGADIDRGSAGDGTTPLLMAAVNGQFDLAMTLLERGADPNVAGVAGTTPLFATLERQWAAKASYAHPTEHQRQQTTHLDLLQALLEAGADPNVRLTSHLWYMEYTFGVLRGSGIHLEGATPFWRAAYALDVDAMRLLKAHGADPSIPTVKAPERRRRRPAEEADSAETEEEDVDHSGVPPVPAGGPNIYPIHAASGVGYGQSFAANAHRHVPGNWLAAVRFLVEECGADVDARDANAYTALHHAASRGDNEVVQYLVDQGADVSVLSRKGETTADMANGPVQRVPPYPETIELLVSLGAKNNDNCVSC